MSREHEKGKESWNVRVPDHAYWREQIKCQEACPVHTDARGYVRAIAEGNDEMAYLIARGPNPLASICGRVCGAPCERSCRRSEFDEPISIRPLKRFVCERFGPEARDDGGKSLIEFLKEASQRYAPRQCQRKEELLPFLQSLTNEEIPRVKGESIGIIGCGPAGLAAAHDLALLGFSVTIYEMEAKLGGMLTVGIPEYRLPRDLIQAEIEVITAMGVKGVPNCCVGRDVSFPELRERHDAVIVAVGAKRSSKLPIPGSNAEGVIGGVEFLRDISIGNPLQLGGRVVVIGGGNVAYDVGRTVLRQISLDAARTAKRSMGVSEVHLCSLESLEEMPADDVEIIEGDEEGVIRHNSIGPKEIQVEDGRVVGVRFHRCIRVFDEQRRFSPLFDENDVTEIPCDNVLISIGQTVDISFIDAERDGLKLTGRGFIACDPVTGTTSVPDVFVAGDLAYGTKLMIHAIASGKSVARSVYEKFTGRKIVAKDVELHFPLAAYKREPGYEKRRRHVLPTTPVKDRLAGQNRPVEKNFADEEARCEASRCLDCSVNTIFDGERCILCGGCVDVCPEDCLRIVPLDQITGEKELGEVLSGQLDGFPSESASAIIKDETVCIRCSLCAERCPTGAITMERFILEEKLKWQVD
ncbi:MAG: FAD-dependent oxidoreductase [bacterium]